jgi:hypothetical protein
MMQPVLQKLNVVEFRIVTRNIPIIYVFLSVIDVETFRIGNTQCRHVYTRISFSSDSVMLISILASVYCAIFRNFI